MESSIKQPLNSDYNEVNNTIIIDTKVLTFTNGLKLFFSISPDTISKYIPHRSGLRVTTAFMVLTLINSTPTTTCAYLGTLSHCDNKTMKRSIEYLMELGLIHSIPAMRYIKPFNSYKQEKTYFITKKGKYVLSKLLDY